MPHLKDDNDIQRQVKTLYRAANKLKSTFSLCSTAVKTSCFVPVHINVLSTVVQIHTGSELPTTCSPTSSYLFS